MQALVALQAILISDEEEVQGARLKYALKNGLTPEVYRALRSRPETSREGRA